MPAPQLLEVNDEPGLQGPWRGSARARIRDGRADGQGQHLYTVAFDVNAGSHN